MPKKLKWLVIALVVGVAGVGARALPSSAGTARDLHLRDGNPDGTVNCTKWCGNFEPCC
jgi:hypothetical protein